MKNINHSGFAAIEAILVCVILGIIGFTGFFVWNAKQETDKSLDSSASSQQLSAESKKTGTLQTYSDPLGNFSFSYPSEWSLKKVTEGIDTDRPSSTADLTSPDKAVTVHFGVDSGGKGGQCEPGPNDKPFAKGNGCATYEVLSSEPLNIKNVYYGRENKDNNGNVTFKYVPADIILVTSHYAVESEESYGIGVTNSNSNYLIKINQPMMGLYDSKEFITVYNSKGEMQPYVYAYANSTSKSFLTSANGEAVKSIFRSLTIDN